MKMISVALWMSAKIFKYRKLPPLPFFFSLYTDAGFFCFLFSFFFVLLLFPLALAVNKSPAVFIFYLARSTDYFEENRGSVNRL